MEIDYNTGLILDAIDEAGIRKNTIFVYFSDNGPTRYSIRFGLGRWTAHCGYDALAR